MGRHPNAKLTPRGRKTLVPRMESAPRSWMPPARWVSAAKPPASGCRAAGPARHPPTGTAAPGGSRSPRPWPDHAPYATSGSARASSSTSTSRKRRAYPTAAGNARWARMRVGGRRQASCLHVAVDDRSGVAYAELLPDERRGACAASSSTVSGPSAQRVRGPSAHVAHRRRKQPIGTQHLVMQQIPIFFRPEK